MSWFTRKIAASLGSQQERASADNNNDGQQALTQGKGLKEDLSELTQTFTRQLWGVASFLAPPPQAQPIEGPDEDLVPVSASQLVNPLNVGEAPLAAELVEVDLQTSKEDIVDKQHIDVEQARHQDVATTPGGRSNLAFTGINKDLTELKGSVSTGISMFMKTMREEVGDEDSFPDDDYTKGKTKSQLPDFNHLFEPFFGSILHDDRDANFNDESNTINEEERANDNNEQVRKAFNLARALGDGLDGISKLASSLFPANLDSDEEGDVTQTYQFQQVVGVNEEVVAFARNISMHPETWMDFPLFTDTEDDDDFEMSDSQRQHIHQVELAAPRFGALRMELCPDYMSESRFLKIYFVLLHSRLPKADATLLSTPEILKARGLLVRRLGNEDPPLERETKQDESFKIVSLQAAAKVAPQDFDRIDDAGSDKVLPHGAQLDVYCMEEVQNKNVLANTVRLTGSKCEDDEADADRWLNEEASVPPTGPFVGLAGNEDDVSFSDFEDEDVFKAEDSFSSQRSSEWVQLNKSRESVNTSKMVQTRSEQLPVLGILSSKPSVRTGKRPENGESSDWSTFEDDDIAGADF